MVNKYVGAGQAVIGVGKKIIQKLSGQGKTTGKEGIKFIRPEKNLTTKRAIQDKTVKAVDEGTKKGMKAAGAKPEFLTSDQKTKLRQSMSKQKRDQSKKIKGVSYEHDRLTKKFAKTKANIEKKKKIKTVAGATAVGSGTAAAGLIGKKIKDKRDKKMGGGMMGRRMGYAMGQSVIPVAKKIKKLMDESKAKKQDAARVKKMGGGMMGRRMGYSGGSNGKKFGAGDGVITPYEKRRGEAIKAAIKARKGRGSEQPPEDPMRDRMKQPLKRKKP